MNIKSTVVFLLVILFAGKSFTGKAQAVNVQDSLALVDLYNSTNGAGWIRNDNWLTSESVSKWYNVAVVDTRVTQIYVYSNNLKGNIPSSIANLTNLYNLHLSGNQLNGSIPPGIGKLPNLEYLDLGYNQLSGSIPLEIGNLFNLTHLSLYNNQLSGSIPPEIGNLFNLTHLSLYNNQLSGSIPPEIGNLKKLINIDFSTNQLTGNIPRELANLSNLNDFFLSKNQLSGNIPPELGNLAKLEELLVSNNQLTGNIPPELGNIVNLGYLDLSNNQLSGSIPAEIGNLLNLQELILAFNQLSGSIPTEIGNLTKVYWLYLNNNQLSGSIPSSFGNLKERLSNLLLNNNQLSGSIPSSLGNLIQPLYDLDLSNNQLSGIIPSSIANLKNLEHLILSNNQLTGSIPSLLSNLKKLNRLNLSNNLLSGGIPFQLGYLTKLNFLQLDHNMLSGSIPPAIASIILNSLAINYNFFTFDGMEILAQENPSVKYSPQANIPVHQINNSLYVSSGGTLSNNTYKWFMVGQPNSTVIAGDSVFYPSQYGKYYAAVTNAVCKALTLYTDTVEYAGILPVTIINLKAQQQGSFIKVDWSSLTEMNVASYQIQRTATNTFNTVGAVAAKGNSTQQQNYSFNDLQPMRGDNYYRLKAIDKDGNIQYSNIVFVNINNSNAVTIVYPVPAKDILHIQTNASASFSLVNQAGKILLTKNINGAGTINVEGLAAGLYYLKNNNSGSIQKIVIAK